MDYYNDPMRMYQAAMAAQRAGARSRRFDEYYRVYPTVMLPQDKEFANHGGKIFLPLSALEKLSQLQITYPMVFDLINGSKGKSTHAGVLEFIAEEGRCYLPFWLMGVLELEPGDLLQLKSTDAPPGTFIKLQPQSVNFLEISDPKAVLETALSLYTVLTVGDIFTFSYNDEVYEIAVLEVKPDSEDHCIRVQETDLNVDFAPPVGYVEPARGSGTSTPRSIGSEMAKKGGRMHVEGTMAQSINYSAIAPSSDTAVRAAAKANSNFAGSGNRLVAKKGKASLTATPASTPGTSTPISGAGGSSMPIGSSPLAAAPRTSAKQRNGPQPLRLPPGKLFFGYEIKPVKRKDGQEDAEQGEKKHFAGEGQSLRKKK